MTVLRAFAPGKVNLSLFVGKPRDDGFHPLASIVQPVSLADELRLEVAPKGLERDEVFCLGVRGPNLAMRAIEAYRAASGWDGPPVRLTIDKRVPVAAGMGGGSGDAAAALRLIACAAGVPGDPLITELAPSLGADVASQVAPKRVLMTGIGEVIDELPDDYSLAVLLIPSKSFLRTPDVYAEFDRSDLGRDSDELAEIAERLKTAATTSKRPLPADLLHNDLQAPALALRGTIADQLTLARDLDGDCAMVSGSGPTVFAVFQGDGAIDRARAAIARVDASEHNLILANAVHPSFAAVQ